MRVTDYILNFLVSKGIDTVFGVTGGFIVPTFDAFHERKDIRYICTQNEQAAVFAADGYARFKGLGCTVTTSGPGATNLVSGIGAAWFDSIPVLCITGQVPTTEAKGNSGVRQRGFQETDIVSIVRSITKYARTISDPEHIALDLEAAIYLAKSGRPGPVLLDVPIDVQQAEIDPDKLMHFGAERPIKIDIAPQVAETVQLIADSKRPVVIYGQGCRHAREKLIQFIEMTGIPCLPSWGGLDLIPHDHPLFVERVGVYSSRAGNLAVQNADLIIAIGTRLDTRMTGSKGFAPKAIKVVVDIDIYEAMKNKPDVMIIADTLDFLKAIIKEHGSVDADERIFFARNEWAKRIAAWKKKYPITDEPSNLIHPHAFVRALCDLLPDDAIAVTDAGAAETAAEQVFHVIGTRRIFSDFGMSCMGYSLPAAIGASIATNRPVVTIVGDGAMQMNIQELQTLAYYQVPVKVFILNNHSYGLIKQFQEEICEGRYEATDETSGYSAPDFQRIAFGYKIPSFRIPNISSMGWMIAQALAHPGPFVCDVEIDPDARIFPKCNYGNSLENQSPLLPPEEVAENMKNE